MAKGRTWLPILSTVAALLLVLSAGQGVEAQAPAAKATAKLLDLNAATQAELEKLPGVGEATAKKIIAGRPYAAGGDVAKALEGAGVRKDAIAKIAPLATIGTAAAGVTTGGGGAGTTGGASTPAPKSTAQAGAKLMDLNTATQAELEKLPGVGEVTAKKIIAGRPYTAGGDVAKALEGAGVRKNATAKIVPLVTIGAASAGAAAAAGGSTPATGSSTGGTAAGGGAKTGATPKATTGSQAPTTTVAQTPPEKGMVWVNTDSKIYHKEGSAWYGKTKQGKFMSEADAIKAGFRAAKNE